MYDIYQVLEEILGLEPQTISGDFRTYYCPFHNDVNNPSFIAKGSTGNCWCAAGCLVGVEPGKEKFADAIDIVRRRFGVGYQKAVSMIEGKAHIPAFEKKPAPEKRAPRYDASKCIRAHDHLDEVWPYFASRHITREQAEFHRFGAHYYGKFKVQRFTMPVMYGHIALAMVSRRDDAAVKALKMDPPDELVRMMAEPGFDFDKITGPRYLTFGTSRYVFNANRLFHPGPSGLVYPITPVVFITEGQIDALNLERYTGAPSLATHGSPDLWKVLQSTEQVIIVRDNDPEDEHGMFPGMRIALSIREQCGLPEDRVHIVAPYPEFKDANDMARAGVIQQWVKEVQHSISVT